MGWPSEVDVAAVERCLLKTPRLVYSTLQPRGLVSSTHDRIETRSLSVESTRMSSEQDSADPSPDKTRSEPSSPYAHRVSSHDAHSHHFHLHGLHGLHGLHLPHFHGKPSTHPPQPQIPRSTSGPQLQSAKESRPALPSSHTSTESLEHARRKGKGHDLGTYTDCGRHANHWLFGDFSFTDTAKEFIEHERTKKRESDECQSTATAYGPATHRQGKTNS